MNSRATISQRLHYIRGDTTLPPNASVIIPVNAKADLTNVLRVIDDLTVYHGSYTLEVLLVVNNYPPDLPPPEIAEFEAMGIHVVAVPDIRKQGEPPGFTARLYGARFAQSDIALLFDADCQIINPHQLLIWYIEQFQQGADVAYSHVGYFDVQNHPIVWVRLFIHHASRWMKRMLLGIPTTRGSNYAIRCSFVLRLYDEGFLADELNVGPVVKHQGGRVVYSGRRALRVLTSGRYLQMSWMELVRYLFYRLRYNMRVLPVRKGAARYTNRIYHDAPNDTRTYDK